MKYLALVYQEKIMNQISQQECMVCGEKLQSSAHMLDYSALQSVDTATTVLVRNGKVTVTDGPFAESK